MKKFILFLIVGIGIAAANCSQPEGVKQVNSTVEKVAVKGFDTVAYFTQEGAIKGDANFQFIWNGAKWFFSNAENLEKFKQNPEKYAPQFGGYCSWAVSHGYTADA